MTTPHIGTSTVYGNQRARTSFTPEQQRILDAGGNYAGYAVVDGHFTYVGAGRTGQEAFYTVYPEQRPAAGDKGTWMSPTSGSSPTPGATTPTDDLATRQRRGDAFAAVAQILADYGLESLAGTVQQWVQQDLSPSEITLKLRDTPEFREAFPEIEARKSARLPAISPAEIINYRRRATELFRAAGLPEGFYDSHNDFTQFITGDVSLSELADRVNLAASAAFRAPKEVRDALAEWGVGPGDITAFWLDPDKAQPLLERKYAAAQLAGASKRSGFGSLREDEATTLAQIGVTQDEAATGFAQLQNSRELFTGLDAGEDTIGRDEQLGARFGGNAQAQARIEARRRRRQAQFEGGGGFASGQAGVVGLGAAPRT